MSIALKPCPFCGGKPNFVDRKDAFENLVAGIACQACPAGMTYQVEDMPYATEAEDKERLRATAEDWNRRSSAAEARATRAEARVARSDGIVLAIMQRWRDIYANPKVHCQTNGLIVAAFDGALREARTNLAFPDNIGHLPPVENAAVAEHLSDVQPNPEPQVNPMLPEGA